MEFSAGLPEAAGNRCHLIFGWWKKCNEIEKWMVVPLPHNYLQENVGHQKSNLPSHGKSLRWKTATTTKEGEINFLWSFKFFCSFHLLQQRNVWLIRKRNPINFLALNFLCEIEKSRPRLRENAFFQVPLMPPYLQKIRSWCLSMAVKEVMHVLQCPLFSCSIQELQPKSF